ncbi:N-formylglutamate amidohydrolase [Mesorhizobium amorphae]|uniref:N-formylglutamate amidohydrolase n=1 Tax=Mesorhizobium amorphae TaxID=71433 RepID=UPI0011859847|nr:N-formylglutamate amidohydrolase [Mesorhizobium amorphae]
MERTSHKRHQGADSVRVTNPDGAGAFVFTCDHASNLLPAEFGTLGLPASDLARHIAWDPGALPVAQILSERLDAPLVETCISRLVLDCNRPLGAPDLIPPVSETTVIPGNENLSAEARQARIDRCWKPFHQAIEDLIEARTARGLETRLVSVHSFTPVYKGIDRPWHIGIIHDEDARLSAPLIAALEQQGGFTVGANQPYSPADRVYFTLERHARSRGLLCAMIEIRNDEIRDQAGQKKWGERLAGIFTGLEPARLPKPPPLKSVQTIEGTI